MNQSPMQKLGARILIVEDDPAHAEAIQRALWADNWTNTEVVETLRDFRIRSVEEPPAIALIDLNLPDGSATELLDHPAAEGLFPLVIMTSYVDIKSVIDVMKAGAFDYMLKSPETFRDLSHNLTRIQREWMVLHERNESVNEINAIYELSNDLIGIADLQGKFRRVNPAFCNTMGYSPEEICSRPVIEFVHPDDRTSTLAELGALAKGIKTIGFNNRYQTKTGAYRWLEWNATLAPQGNLVYAVARDITDRKAAEDRIHYLAYYDVLTMLPNRRMFADRLQRAMAAGVRSLEYAVLLFIDLDNFKSLNDSHGHNYGDLMLIEVAHRLIDCVRDVDTVARLGGDEFVVLVEGLDQNQEHAAERAMLIGEKIRESIARPYTLEGIEFHSSASLGMSLFCGDAVNLDDLFRHADSALYQAKDAGRNSLRFFDPKMQHELEVRARLEADLRYALTSRQFSLHYQKQVDIRGAVIGAEVLLRWTHPQDGVIPPLKFIPIAEHAGLIEPIGIWVMQAACEQIKSWQGDPHTAHIHLSINVSARQFRNVNFVGEVIEIIQNTGINPQMIKLELTESLVLDDIEICISKMQALREFGVRISMDDFGTGQSSLTYLRRLPLDQIKIDQSFVRDITTNQSDAAIVKIIIMMANNLGLEVIAEGVETEHQRDFLQRHGCNLYQGYLFGKPVPIEEFELVL